MPIPDTRVILFGNPRVGTKLMLKNSTLAVDLPSHLLVHDRGNAITELAFSTMEFASRRHGLEEPVSGFNEKASKLIEKCADKTSP